MQLRPSPLLLMKTKSPSTHDFPFNLSQNSRLVLIQSQNWLTSNFPYGIRSRKSKSYPWGTGHSFLVLEGPLSEDTHFPRPRTGRIRRPTTSFFFFFTAPYHNVPEYFYLFVFINFLLLNPPFFFSDIGLIVTIAIIVETSLNFFL